MPRKKARELERETVTLALLFALTKGLIVSVLLYTLGVVFWQQLIITLVSAGLTGSAVILSALISARAAAKNRREIRHIKRRLNLDKREEDRVEGPGA